MDKETLRQYGIDYERGLKNCMNNPAFYKKILKMFADDKCFAGAKAAYLSGDSKELFCRMHEMKGISGNAALTALYAKSAPLVELLRRGEGTKQEIDELFEPFEREYLRACEGIRLLLEEN